MRPSGLSVRGCEVNRNQRAAARRLSLTAYLLSSGGRFRSEEEIQRRLPAYPPVYPPEPRDEERDHDALRKLLERDVEALEVVGISIEISTEAEGRRYRLPPGGFSPLEVDLSGEERQVLAATLRALRRNFPYSGPFHLALTNLLGAVSRAPDTGGVSFAADLGTSGYDDAVAGRLAKLEQAIARRKLVAFDYYAISRNETAARELEPYLLSFGEGNWYVVGRDTARRDLREFRVDRVSGRVGFVTKRPDGDFTVPSGFDAELYNRRAPWQLGPPVGEARIHLTPEAAELTGRLYPGAGEFVEDPGASPGAGPGAVFVTPYHGERQLAAWAASLGGSAKVLHPAALQTRAVEGLQRLVRAHTGSGAEVEGMRAPEARS